MTNLFNPDLDYVPNFEEANKAIDDIWSKHSSNDYHIRLDYSSNEFLDKKQAFDFLSEILKALHNGEELSKYTFEEVFEDYSINQNGTMLIKKD